jgi:GAF domain-containing protein
VLGARQLRREGPTTEPWCHARLGPTAESPSAPDIVTAVMQIDDGQISDSVERLRRADVRSRELESAIREVVAATKQVFSADGAGLMLIDDDDALHYVGTSDERSDRFEAAQERTGEGPCVDSLVLDQVVSSTDLLDDDRWPRLRALVADTGIRAMLGVPVRIGGSAVGSLNVFRADPSDWSDSEVRAITAHARMVEEVLGAAMLADARSTVVQQLQHALDHRVTIERAIGVVMARRGVDATLAFQHLRQRARNERRPVREIADEVLTSITRHDPSPNTE